VIDTTNARHFLLKVLKRNLCATAQPHIPIFNLERQLAQQLAFRTFPSSSQLYVTQFHYERRH
jgi:hypothetical protein